MMLNERLQRYTYDILYNWGWSHSLHEFVTPRGMLMIFFIIGGVGSGKSLSAVREIVDKQPHYALTNFKLKSIKNYHRLKISDIIIKDEDNKGKHSYRINWDFWEKIRREHPDFSIYLDETGYLASSRSSMTGRNKQMIIWFSQVRKVLQDAPNNHIFIISQRPKSVDIGLRELAQYVILCKKLVICEGCYAEKKEDCTCLKPNIKTIIFQYIFENTMLMDLQITPELLKYAKKDCFEGNDYFKYFDSREIIRFGESEYL